MRKLRTLDDRLTLAAGVRRPLSQMSTTPMLQPTSQFKSVSLKIALAATAIALTASTASAATHHRDMRFTHACSTLADQWSSAIASHDHDRQARRARHQESIGARDCRSSHSATRHVGVEHYRSALRILGVKPHA